MVAQIARTSETPSEEAAATDTAVVPCIADLITEDPLTEGVLEHLQAVVNFAVEEIKRLHAGAVADRLVHMADRTCLQVDAARKARAEGYGNCIEVIERCASIAASYAAETERRIKQYKKFTAR